MSEKKDMEEFLQFLEDEFLRDQDRKWIVGLYPFRSGMGRNLLGYDKCYEVTFRQSVGG